MNTITNGGMVTTTAIISVIIALSQAAKNLGLNAKYVPLLNLSLGVAFSVAFSTTDIKLSIFNGLIIGLSASGMFSTQKNMRQCL